MIKSYAPTWKDRETRNTSQRNPWASMLPFSAWAARLRSWREGCHTRTGRSESFEGHPDGCLRIRGPMRCLNRRSAVQLTHGGAGMEGEQTAEAVLGNTAGDGAGTSCHRGLALHFNRPCEIEVVHVKEPIWKHARHKGCQTRKSTWRDGPFSSDWERLEANAPSQRAAIGGGAAPRPRRQGDRRQAGSNPAQLSSNRKPSDGYEPKDRNIKPQFN